MTRPRPDCGAWPPSTGRCVIGRGPVFGPRRGPIFVQHLYSLFGVKLESFRGRAWSEKSANAPERDADFETLSGIPLEPVYELVRALSTTDDTSAAARHFVETQLHKQVIVSKDRAGFIVHTPPDPVSPLGDPHGRSGPPRTKDGTRLLHLQQLRECDLGCNGSSTLSNGEHSSYVRTYAGRGIAQHSKASVTCVVEER
jgi:hypothetical protein